MTSCAIAALRPCSATISTRRWSTTSGCTCAIWPRPVPRTRREFTDLAGAYLRQVDKRLIRALPATRKLAYYLIAAGRQDDLVEFASWLAGNPGRTPPVVRSFGRLRADLPFRRPASGARRRAGHWIPASVFTPQWRELAPQVRVDALSWQRRSLVIEGSAYVPSMDIVRRRNTTKLVVLVPRGRRRPPIACSRPVGSPAGRDGIVGAGSLSYDWAGFPMRDQPALVRHRRVGSLADRRVGLLRAGQRPVGVAAGPAAFTGPAGPEHPQPKRRSHPA